MTREEALRASLLKLLLHLAWTWLRYSLVVARLYRTFRRQDRLARKCER